MSIVDVTFLGLTPIDDDWVQRGAELTYKDPTVLGQLVMELEHQVLELAETVKSLRHGQEALEEELVWAWSDIERLKNPNVAPSKLKTDFSKELQSIRENAS